jgi:peptide/nickel transport system permease protein
MSLWWYALRRLLLLVPVLLAVTLVTFLLANFIPGDPLAAVLGDQAMENPAIVARYEREWGFDKPLPERYLVYVTNLLHGDWGRSLHSQRPVLDDLSDYLPATIELAVAAMSFALLVGLVVGIVAALNHRRPLDHLLRFIALVGSSMPVFWLGLIALEIFYVQLGIAPGPVGRLSAGVEPPPKVTGLYTIDSLIRGDLGALMDAIRHILLPAIVLGYFILGLIARMIRSSLLDVQSSDYLLTARAKGLAERAVIMRHALPNALIPTVTVVGVAFAGLLSGAVLTESVFAWPGIGRYAVASAQGKDYQALLGVTIVVSIVYAFANLVVDVLYGLLDPRIRLGR